MKSVQLLILALCFGLFSSGLCGSVPSRPAVVKIRAFFTFNTTVGNVSKVAIDAAVDDVNADPNVLGGSKLVVDKRDLGPNMLIEILEGLQFMDTDVVAVLGPQSSTITHIMSLVSNELQVPLISFSATDPTLSSLQYPFLVRATQSDAFQMAAISEVVDYFQWKQVAAIFTDNDYGRNGIDALDDKLAEKNCEISYRGALRLGFNRDEVIDLLIKIALLEPRIIIVHADLHSGLNVFSAAQYLNMMGNGYVWIATDWLSSYLDSISYYDSDITKTLQGVLTLRQHTTDSKQQSDLVSRWSNLVKKASNDTFRLNSFGLYAYDTVWIVAKAVDAFFNDGGVISFSNDSKLHGIEGGVLHLDSMSLFDQGKLLLDKIKKTNFVGVTGSIRFDSDGNLINPAYDIMNVVGPGMWLVGYWSNYSGLSVIPPEELFLKTPNHSVSIQKLHSVIWPGETTTKPRGWVFPNDGRVLRIAVPNRVGYQQFISKSPASGMIKGYCIDVFVAAVNLLPYAVPHNFIPFGNGHENPSYTDLVYRVSLGEFDAAVGDITIDTNRTRITDFTQPYVESGLVILVAIKEKPSHAWAFLQPFTLEMWCITGLSFIFIGLVLWILEHRINEEFRGSLKEQLVTIVWFSLSTLFFVHRENVVSGLGRIVLLMWLFVVLIIQSSYTASLTSILTVQQLSSPINGIADLIASKEPIGFQAGSFTGSYLAEELGIASSRLKPLASSEDFARALQLGPVNGGVAAVVDERPYVELFLTTHCEFKIVGSDFTKSGWGFVFRRDSPLVVDLSTAIIQLSEDGELDRIHEKWLTGIGCSSDNAQVMSDKLRLSSFWGLFMICGVACFLALVGYFLSMIYLFIYGTHKHEEDPSVSRSGWSSYHFRKFLSLLDEKDERSSKGRRISNDSTGGDSIYS